MSDIRKSAREKRRNIDKKLHEEFSENISKKVLKFIDDKNIVMLYNAIDGEVDISYLSQLKNKTFLYPRVEGDNIFAVKGEKFISGAYGISEPVGDVYNGRIDVVIVPMCAYDKSLNRMGFGKGYYDRFLQNRNCLKIGVAFSCQETDDIFVKDTDVKMDIIITEKEILGAE